MSLTKLKSPAAAGRWLKSWVTGTLRTDSRAVQPGDGFLAWPGYQNDGRRFVKAALDAGATTCLVDQDGVEPFAFEDARIATLPKMKAAAGHIANVFFDQPSHALSVIATTGTNGKTSTAWWTAQALTLLGKRCGVVGTLGVGEPPAPGDVDALERITATGLTTPDQVLLQGEFRRMVDAGFAACAIEASSIGIVEQRLAGTRIEVALFTNFTRDHLDYHGSMDAYWAAKRLLFGWPGLKAAVVNVDDAAGEVLAEELAGGALDLWTYSTRADSGARLVAESIGYRDGGLAFTLQERRGQVSDLTSDATDAAGVATTLIGDYNVHNLLSVIGGLRALGIPLADAAHAAQQVTPVPGRMQRIDAPAAQAAAATAGAQLPQVVVDYAHTPDALEKVVAALRPLAADRGGRLWCVFGCGGDRDATKRPLMGGIAAQGADRVVVTSDNPRGEDPQAIVAQVAAGAPGATNVSVEVDRRVAIARAVAEAAPQDVILVAGKGHEDYQEIAGVRHPFSDAVEARAALQKRAEG